MGGVNVLTQMRFEVRDSRLCSSGFELNRRDRHLAEPRIREPHDGGG